MSCSKSLDHSTVNKNLNKLADLHVEAAARIQNLEGLEYLTFDTFYVLVNVTLYY